jgi:hypothetical protein
MPAAGADARRAAGDGVVPREPDGHAHTRALGICWRLTPACEEIDHACLESDVGEVTRPGQSRATHPPRALGRM